MLMGKPKRMLCIILNHGLLTVNTITRMHPR